MPKAELPNLIPVLPEVFLVCAAMALLMLGVFQKAAPGKAGDIAVTRLISTLGTIALLLTLLLVMMVSGPTLSIFGDMFVSDPFASFFKILILAASAVALVLSRAYCETQEMARFEFPILILFAAFGMMLMISANDLIAMYVGLETQSLALYLVAAFQRDDSRSSEAGLKYFVLGAMASGMLLYGASLVYGFVGATGFTALAESLGTSEPSIGTIVGLVFIVAGLAFKVSAVPFHMWTPDVYEGAPTPVTAFFSVAPKAAALALFLRVMIGPFGDLFVQWQQIIVVVSVASMLLGAFAAIGQTNIKRMMAYSSIGHVGYALIGLAVGDTAGVRGVLIYMAIYAVMNLGAFACILCMRRNERMVEDISDLSGLGRSHPLVAAAMAIFMFSMAGIPPLAGFFGKLYIFLAAIEAQLFALAIIGVLSSVVAAFYYLRIVKVMYFDDVLETLERPVKREIAVVLLGTGLLVLLFFIYPGPLLDWANVAASALFAG